MIASRLEALLARAGRLTRSPRARAIGLPAALILFAIGLVLAWRSAGIGRVALGPVLVNLAMVPVAVLATTWQLRCIARLAGATPTWWEALRVTTLGSLSGLLPMASGTVVRGGAVVYWGAGVAAAGRAFAIDALVWAAVTLTLSGGAALWLGHASLGALFLVGGIVAIPVFLALGARAEGGRALVQLVLARATGVAAEAVRLLAAFAALEHAVRALHGLILTAPGVLAGFLFFLPGGLGVKEAITAGLAGILDLGAAEAFLAAALSRVLGLAALLGWEILLWVGTRVPGAGARGRNVGI